MAGKSIYTKDGVKNEGTLVIQHYYTGSAEPSASLGIDGDIYIQE